MSTGGKYENQNRKDQEPTITEKSSGIEYLKNNIEPKHEGVGNRAPSTKNDKG